VDWGTLVGALGGAVVGGGLSILGQSFDSRRRRRESREARATEALLAVRNSLLAFRNTFSSALMPDERYIDTSDNWWVERVDAYRAEVLLVTNADARKRLEDIANVLGLIDSVAGVVDNGETCEEIGYELMTDDAMELVGACLRGERLPSESPLMRQCRLAAKQVRTRNDEAWRKHVAERVSQKRAAKQTRAESPDLTPDSIG
jgi:hypothetical protein